MDKKQKIKLIVAIVLFIVAGFVIWFLNIRKPDTVVIKPPAGSGQSAATPADAGKPGTTKPQADLTPPAKQNPDRPLSPQRVAPPGGG